MDLNTNMRKVDAAIKQLINPLAASLIATFILVYADEIRVPFEHDGLFDNQIFKAAVLFLIISYFTKQPTISLGVALSIMVALKQYQQQPNERVLQVQRVPQVEQFKGREEREEHDDEFMYKQKDLGQFTSLLPVADDFPPVKDQDAVRKPSRSEPVIRQQQGVSPAGSG